MMRSLVLALFISFATLGLTHRANAIPVVAAEYDALGNQGFGVGASFFAGQTFLSTESGTVLDVSILARQTTPPGFITIGLAETSAGVPGSILDSVTVLNPILSDTPALFTVDFSSVNIDLLAGTTYAVIVSADIGVGVRLDNPGSYADGQAFRSSDSGASWTPFNDTADSDYGFRVRVDSVASVPDGGSTILLMTLALGVLGLIRRK